MTNQKQEQIMMTLRNPLFYPEDFKNGYEVKNWWNSQFLKASKLSMDELKEWAEMMLQYVDDIAVYYIKAETEQFLKEIIEG